MPKLIPPVINEVFQTSYSEEEPLKQFRNEHHTESGEVITDSCFGIQNKVYHVECQSTPDSIMAVRMMEYDFSIAVERVEKNKKGVYEIRFPYSCVLYLRHYRKTPDTVRIQGNLQDGKSFVYEVPIMKVQNYTKDMIFEKNLFLPFYILRYERRLSEIENSPEESARLAEEYTDIRQRLEKIFSGEEEAAYYAKMLELIQKILEYVLRKNSRLKERIGDIMGGKILELEVDKAIQRGLEQGLERGLEQGMKNGIGRGEDRLSTLINYLLSEGRTSDIRLVTNDREARQAFYKKYGITN